LSSRLNSVEFKADWAHKGIQESITPSAVLPGIELFKPYYLAQLQIDKKAERITNITNRCDSDIVSAANLNACLNEKKYGPAEKIALKVTENKETRSAGLYYLSLVAEAQNNPIKALWMINKVLAADNDLTPAKYQKWKVLYSVEGFNSAFKYFEKDFFTQQDLVESKILRAVKFFSERDYSKLNQEFSGLSSEQIYNYGMDLIHIESKLQIGDTETALKAAKMYAGMNSGRAESDLSLARVYESFLNNRDKAIECYKNALSKTKIPDQKSWINKKIDFLKTKNTQISSNVGAL